MPAHARGDGEHRRLIAPQRLQEIAGVGAFSFNTCINWWLKEHHPQLLGKGARPWLFISLVDQSTV